MKGLCKAALAILVIAACGRDGGITQPDAPRVPPPASGFNALGTDPVTGASIETNKDDYAPGEVVHLVGRGWATGETVNLHMTEVPNTHADVDTNIVTDAAGGFSVHFYDVQVHDIGVTFTLTATGAMSGSVAVATFTDGRNVDAVTLTPASPVGASVSVSAALRVVLNPGTGATVWQATQWDILNSSSSVIATSGCLNTTNHSTADGDIFSGNKHQESVSFTSPAGAGSYTFRVRLYSTDNCAANSNDPTSFDQPFSVAVAANVAPIIDAGAPYSGAEGSAIPLSAATATDADGDALSYKWTVSTPNIDGAGTCSFSPSDVVLNPSVTCTDDSEATPGTFTLTLEVKDGAGGHTVTDNAVLTVTNAIPTANATGGSGAEGSAIQLAGSGNDPGDNDDLGLTFAWSVDATGIDNGGVCNLSSATAQNPTVTCTDDGSFTVSLVVSDDDGGSSVGSSATLTVTNAIPTANATGGSGIEGSAIQLAGSGSDPGANDGLTYAWSVNSAGMDGGTCTFSPNNTAQNPTITCPDDSQQAAGGKFSVSLVVTDDDGGVSTASTADLTVTNDPPAITTITSPLAPVPFGPSNVTVAWNFTDPGTDTWTCSIEWDTGLGFTSATYVASKSCSATASLTPGLYSVTIKVADDDGGADVETLTAYIVVYDPNGGFVTGGGWINSLAGFYRLDTNAAGKANFGFVSKYLPGKNVPQGNTEFQFHAGNLNFKSTVYEWLVVAGTKAMYKGEGTIAGRTGVYGFLLSAIDGSPDKFRIKIWEKTSSGDVLVYDTLPVNAADDADPTTTLGGGSIVVQTKK